MPRAKRNPIECGKGDPNPNSESEDVNQESPHTKRKTNIGENVDSDGSEGSNDDSLQELVNRLSTKETKKVQ